jgi:hypothetical protein
MGQSVPVVVDGHEFFVEVEEVESHRTPPDQGVATTG